jgi:histidinol-phosphate aminotransferase
MNPEKLVRKNILELKPYRSAREDHRAGLLLDANENAFGSPVTFDGVDLHRYPDPYQSALRSRLAAMNNTSPANIFVGAGSDEIIDLLYRVFCEPSIDNVVIPEPTYGMYRVSANIHNVKVTSSLLTDEFQLNVQEIMGSVDTATKMIFCCSPNNPTGNLLRKDDILHLCSSVKSLVVVDEAYIEFAGTDSLANRIPAYPNLVIMRTCSKSWGLAGIRLGYCMAHEKIIAYLLKVKAPYNVNSVSAVLALRALDNSDERHDVVTEIRKQRERLVYALHKEKFVLRVYPSDANFILVRVTDAKSLYAALLERHIIIRDRSSEPKLDNCVRITVGTPEENNMLIGALEEISL